VGIRIVVPIVDLEEAFPLDEVRVLFVRHRRDTLLDQLLQRLDVQRVRDQLLQTAHLQKGAHLHLSVLLLDVTLAKNDTLRVHILVDVHLEQLFQRLHIGEVDLDGLLRKNVDGVLAHFR